MNLFGIVCILGRYHGGRLDEDLTDEEDVNVTDDVNSRQSDDEL